MMPLIRSSGIFLWSHMKYRFFNANVMISPEQNIFKGELCTDGADIVYVGKKKNEGFIADREIDCNGNLLMSGFCNAHSHAAMSLFRGIADDLPLEKWLFDRIFPMEDHLTEDDVYWGTLLQIAEFVRNGITCFADMYFYPDTIYEAAKKSNLAVALCGGTNGESNEKDLRFIRDHVDLYSTMSDRVRYIIGLHAEYTCEENLISDVSDIAAEYGSKTYIHLSETLKEVGDCTVRHNLTPPQYLHKLGFFENGGLAAHCTYCDKDDLALLKQCGVVPVINAASNLKLASGVAPVYSMLRSGMKVALGTDGSASNNATSMFREMYLFSCLQKEAMKDASAVSAEEALTAATVNGYEALGFRGGVLKTGNFADIILIDLAAPNMRPLSDVKKNLVYSADSSNVLMTVAGGKIVYENGKYDIGEEISTIYLEAEHRRDRLFKEAGFKE